MAITLSNTPEVIEAPDLTTLLSAAHAGQWVAFSGDYKRILASGESVGVLLTKLSEAEKTDAIFYRVPPTDSYYIPAIR
jgi:hypothetical protein